MGRFYDKIDEIPQSRREEARKWISNLKAQYKENYFVLTSRPTAVRNTSNKKEWQTWHDWLVEEEISTLELQDLVDDDLSHFIAHWHKAPNAWVLTPMRP